MQIPSSLRLAVKSQEDLAAAAAERAELKRLVLQASEDQAVFQPPHPSTRDIQPRAKNVAKGRKLEIPIEFSDTHSNPEPRAQNRAPSGRGRGGTARQSRYPSASVWRCGQARLGYHYRHTIKDEGNRSFQPIFMSHHLPCKAGITKLSHQIYCSFSTATSLSLELFVIMTWWREKQLQSFVNCLPS